MRQPAPKETFWTYEPTPARIVNVIVGPAERETFWHNGLEGTVHEAVEVSCPGGEPFYLSNEATGFQEAGQGWAKVTYGRGGPEWGHAEIPVREIIAEVPVDESPNVAALMDRLSRQASERATASRSNRKPPLRREDFPSRQAFRHAQRKAERAR